MNKRLYLLFFIVCSALLGQDISHAELDKNIPQMVLRVQTDKSYKASEKLYQATRYDGRNRISEKESVRRNIRITKESGVWLTQKEAFRRELAIHQQHFFDLVDTSTMKLVSYDPYTVKRFLHMYNKLITHNWLMIDSLAFSLRLPYLLADSLNTTYLLLGSTSYNTLAQCAQELKPHFQTKELYTNFERLKVYCLLLTPEEKKVLLTDSLFLSSVRGFEESGRNMAPILALLGSDSAESVVLASYAVEMKKTMIDDLVYIGSDKAIRTLLASFYDKTFYDSFGYMHSSCKPIIEILNRRYHNIPIIEEFHNPILIGNEGPMWEKDYVARVEQWIFDAYGIIPQGGAPKMFTIPGNGGLN